jgi:hypothetical protein
MSACYPVYNTYVAGVYVDDVRIEYVSEILVGNAGDDSFGDGCGTGFVESSFASVASRL